MRARASGWRSGVFLCAVAVAVAALGLLEPRASHARAGDTVSLLVKCDRRVLPELLRSLADHGAEAWELESMRRLRLPARPEPTPTKPVPMPALPDATRVMHEVMLVIPGLHDHAKRAHLEVEEVVVQERRAIVRFSASDPRVFDGLRQHLAKNAYLLSRAADPKVPVELGAAQELPTGRWKQSLQFKFHLDVPPVPPGRPQAQGISLRAVHEQAHRVGLKVIYAGPEQNDPHRAKGYRTISREFTVAPVRLAQLLKFVGRLAADANGLTVFELRWKRDRRTQAGDVPKDLLYKSVLKVGYRAPLAH